MLVVVGGDGTVNEVVNGLAGRESPELAVIPRGTGRDFVRTYGIPRGLVLATWRLLRCNPWSHGGVDPVEAQTIFRTRTL